jgi:hypothetical protein
MKNITEAELNKAIATPPNSSLPQLDTSPGSDSDLYTLERFAIETTAK